MLSDGLAAVVAARPRDPVEYLGVYLMQQAARMDSSANVSSFLLMRYAIAQTFPYYLFRQ